MSAIIASCETIQLAIRTKVKLSGISNQSDEEAHSVTVDIHGGWQLEACVPKAPVDDEVTPLGLFVYAPSNSVEQRIGDSVEVVLSVQSLRGGMHASESFQWAVPADSAGRGFPNILDWNNFWHKNPDHRTDDGFYVLINITSIPISTRPAVFEPTMLQTITQLIQGQVLFSDTKFFVFSQPRFADQGRGAQDPLPVYANAAFLREQCEYFGTMFSDSAFSESKQLPLDAPPETQWIEEYDYESDSDLGYVSDDEDDRGLESSTVSSPVPGVGLLKGEEQDTLDLQVVSLPAVSEQLADTKPDADIGVLLHQSSPTYGGERFGNIVPVKDAAFVTWRAMIFFLSSSQISFAPLSSSKRSRARSSIERDQGIPSKPSAKSMYRLADKLGLDDLCKLSLSHIQSQLSEDNIMHEVFSAFTSRYKSVRDMELTFLFDHWEELKGSQRLRGVIKAVTRGELPHATDVLEAILAH